MTFAYRSLDAAAWGRVFVAWLALALVMSLNGIFRELALRSLFGPRVAGVVSAVLGIALVLLTTRTLLPPLDSSSTTALASVCVVIGLSTVAFETVLGVVVDHKSRRQLVEHYALWHGELWPVVLAVLVLTPFIWGRWWPLE
jgi:hypothetical protein